jgi:hypothetical protein
LKEAAVLDPKLAGLFAYVGPGPGLELVPYFFSLLTWVGLAFGAVLLWPISVLLGRLRGEKAVSPQIDEPPSQSNP